MEASKLPVSFLKHCDFYISGFKEEEILIQHSVLGNVECECAHVCLCVVCFHVSRAKNSREENFVFSQVVQSLKRDRSPLGNSLHPATILRKSFSKRAVRLDKSNAPSKTECLLFSLFFHWWR